MKLAALTILASLLCVGCGPLQHNATLATAQADRERLKSLVGAYNDTEVRVDALLKGGAIGVKTAATLGDELQHKVEPLIRSAAARLGSPGFSAAAQQAEDALANVVQKMAALGQGELKA
jgi:hypothetical protein